MKIYKKKPEWLKVRIDNTPEFKEITDLVDVQGLNTVCRSAKCPNISDCWSRRTATFMILGDICTRSCSFCAVKTGKPGVVDTHEPIRVAEAVKKLDLKYVVITSVDRDDLDDGGASIFAAVIKEIKMLMPSCKVEVLIPDFKGDKKALSIVFDAKPDVLNHNIETIARLYKTVRPQAQYKRSLELLAYAKEMGMTTKTGFMVGLGESVEEIHEILKHIKEHNVDIVTIGQYLQPSRKHSEVEKYYTPEEFKNFKKFGENVIGIDHIESGPLIRSSYHADEIVENIEKEVPKAPVYPKK